MKSCRLRILGRLLAILLPAAVVHAAEPPLLVFPPIDPPALLARDQAIADANAGKPPGPLQFAEPIDVAITPRTDGNWETSPGGARTWRLGIQVPAATDLNFGFGRFEIPDGASMTIEGGPLTLGPFTRNDSGSGQLWTAIVPGDRATITLTMPAGAGDPDLELSRIGAGYRDIGRELELPVPKSGSCNNDVACPEGVPWANEVRAAVRYSIGAGGLCSGTLVADVPHDWRPYILTANHCGINAANAASIVVYWHYQASTCNGPRDGAANAVSQSGATYRASNRSSDFSLFELTAAPVTGSTPYWAGWDRGDVPPNASVAIHHPNGDEKAITFDNDPLTKGENCIERAGMYPDTHWYVGAYEDGTTEPGSSGSGIFDRDSHLLVGTLSGGAASCTNLDYDCWGRFARHWDTGATPDTRLSNWLDPAGTGATSTPGGDPNMVAGIALDSFEVRDACALGLGNANGLAEPGEVVTLVPHLVASGGTFTAVRGVLSTTSAVTINDANATWGDLSPGTPLPSDPPHFKFTIPTSAACGSTLDFNLSVSSTEGGPYDLPISIPVGDPAPSPVVPMNIIDLTTVTSDLVIQQDVTIASLAVHVRLTHSYVGDLRLQLQSPTGGRITLLDRPGSPAVTGGCADDNMDVTFTDASTFDLEPHCDGTDPWYVGEAASVTPLSAFAGLSTRGTWTLRVADYSTGDVGTIDDWELITTPAFAGGCQACMACPGQRIADTDPNVLRVRKGATGSVILSFPGASSACASGVQVRMGRTARPTVGPGSFPNDPPFADVTSQDLDAGADFRHVPPAGNEYYLVVEDLAGSPGPSGSYGF